MVKDLTQEIIDETIRTRFIDCAHIHDHSCELNTLVRSLGSFKYALRIYGLIHVLPAVVFRGKELRKNPLESLKQIVFNILKSCFMMVSYLMAYRYA